MELSLHGSQINLATRYKPTTPAVRYPIHYNRPGSAAINRCSSSTSSLSTFKDHHTNFEQIFNRPLSADGTIYRNNLKGHFQNFSREAGAVNQFNRKIKRPASSSNILNILLSEPIKRSWGSPSSERDLSSNLNLRNKTKNRSHIKMIKNNYRERTRTSFVNDDDDDDQQEDLSVEEDINDEISSEEDSKSNKLKEQITSQRLQANRNIAQKFPLHYNNKSMGDQSEQNSKKYVTFSKKTEIVPDVSGQSDSLRYSSHSDSTDLTKPDLPGRVSFSKNDVYEIDYSDYENETVQKHTNSINRYAIRNDSNSSEESCSTVAGHDKIDSTTDKFCCSSKCNSLTDHAIDEPSTEKYNNFSIDESNNIIEDYKREIDSLNRQHRIDIASANDENDYQMNNESLPKTSPIPLIVVSNISSTDDTKELNDNNNWNNKDSNKKFAAQIDKSYDKTKIIKDSSQALAESGSKSKDSSTEVINNYLKTTNQNLKSSMPHINQRKQNNLLKFNKTSNEMNNMEAIKKTTVKNKKNDSVVKKIKSADRFKSSLEGAPIQKRQSSKLDIFQIDKVESWMSIHENNFRGEKNMKIYDPKQFTSDSPGSNNNNLHLDDEYNQAWRETPSSTKTDDERNFNFEVHDDGIIFNQLDTTTYDEIVSVIKEIDEEKKVDSDTGNRSSLKLNIAESPTTLSSVQSFSNDHHESNDKMREILSYLDGVDSSCTKTMQETFSAKIPDSFRSEIEFTVEPDIVGDIPKISDLIILPNQQLARRIVSLSLRANELATGIQLSKEHVESVRKEKLKSIRAEKQNSQTRLSEQKNHFENIIQRHQGFIEQLLKDKAELCEKVSGLTRRCESQNQAWEHKLQTEILRVKETSLAGEKIRRERWVRENTKKIKELTVKGLEQEINKMTCNHQMEITELKRQHQQDLLDALDEARQKHEIMERGIRESYAQDREISIEKERSAIRERFERQIAHEQHSFEEQKNRIITEFGNEKERFLTEFRVKELEFENRKEELVNDKHDAVEHLKCEFKERLILMDKKNQADLSSLRDQYESDFTIWKREHENGFKLREAENENTIRQQCRMDRDRQIDEIVAKVDTEALKTQQEFELKMNRLKDKYESELRDIERTERITRDKYTDLRARLAECEADRQNYQSTVKQLEMQLDHSQKMCDSFIKEKENLKEAARQEIQQEIQNIKKERDCEIERIHSRVQQAIEKKDSTLDFLQKENAAFKERCIKLEALIRQQRKDYCTK